MAEAWQIVPATLDHLEGFHAALDAVARERKYIARFEAPPLEESRRFMGLLIEAGLPFVVALSGGKVTGWCDIARRSDREIFRHVGVLGMGVVSSHRGRGIGTALINTTLDSAWQAGLSRVELTVYATNEPAILLYEKAGFTLEGRARNAARLDGSYVDLLHMAVIDTDRPDLQTPGSAGI